MEMGERVLKVKPWTEITIDGRALGRALLRKNSLGPSPHTLVLSHPGLGSLKPILRIRPQSRARGRPRVGAPDRKVLS
jgi:hypothetical protein